MNNRRHYIAAISAFSIWGFFPISLRTIKEYNAGEILYFRILFSAVVLLLIIIGFKRNKLNREWMAYNNLTSRRRRDFVALTLIGGALLTVNWLTFIYIVNNINLKTASFSYLICPVITAALGYVLIKERLTAIQWASVALCAISCVFIGMSSMLELGYSILTAFTYALYLISQRKNQGFDRLIVLGIQMCFALLLLSLTHTFLVDKLPVGEKFYTIIFLIAVVFTILPLFLNLFALNRINSATIGILMYINPLINFSIAILIYKESLDYTQYIGYSVVAVALVIFNFQTIRKMQPTSLSR